MGEEDSMTVEHRYGWVMVVVSSILMGMGAGALISISAFLKPLIAEFGWLRGETSFGYMVGALAQGLMLLMEGAVVMAFVAGQSDSAAQAKKTAKILLADAGV